MRKLVGFTLVEVMVVVAVLAAVLTIATPDINRLFSKQYEMTEALRLKIIYRALEAYAKDNKKLPDNSTWNSDLAKYSELSEEEILNDVWGNQREYQVFTKEFDYMGGSYDAYYATIASKGREPEYVGSLSLPTNIDEFSRFNLNTKFGGSKPRALGIKYTDRPNKVKLLEVTLKRMEKMSAVLAKYARVKQIDGLVSDPANSDSYIYFPNDGKSDGNYYPGDASHEGVFELSKSNDASELAQKLGLPEEYGQDAITGESMIYISNPDPNGNPAVGSDVPMYPPIIKISNK